MYSFGDEAQNPWIKASIPVSALSVSTQGEEKFRRKRPSTSPQKGKEKIIDCFKQEKRKEAKVRQGEPRGSEKFPRDHATVRCSYRCIHRSSLDSNCPSTEPASPKVGQFLPSALLLDSPRYIWTSTNILNSRSHWTKLPSLSSQTTPAHWVPQGRGF